MSEPYIGEIRCFGFSFAPRGWAWCNGQSMAVASNEALFTIIGTTYGGDGVTNFALPNLQGRIPMHWGSGGAAGNTVLGQLQGQSTQTLSVTQIPAHRHVVEAATTSVAGERTAIATDQAYLSGSRPPNRAYQNPSQPPLTAQFSPKAISPNGGSQPHDNMQPYLVMNFCIALEGIYPSRN
jgi:microcystin-dependent protein